MKKKIKELLLSVLLISCVSLPMFAVDEYVSEVYKEIDTAFGDRSDKKVNFIL